MMSRISKRGLTVLLVASWLGAQSIFAAGESPATKPSDPAKATAATKPVLKITPGKVIVPTDAMHRIWGELISIDLATRTGKFRKETTDEVMNFTVLPYAELLHHAAFGDLEDFRIGERAIFRMHENEKSEWVWLTYIQDEMNMMNGHREYFYVDAIDSSKKQLTCTQANFDKSFIRTKDIQIQTDGDTRYWKDGRPAAFTDIKVGDKLRTQTHGVGKGAVRVCWEVFLDDASLLKFQTEQKTAHAKRMALKGLPGYVDSNAGKFIELTLFQEGAETARTLKAKQKVRLAPAGADRKPILPAVEGSVTAVKMQGNLCKVTVMLDEGSPGFHPGEVSRLWPMP